MNTAAKDLRKNYSKKICEKLVLLMKTTIRALANHFKALLVTSLVPSVSTFKLKLYPPGGFRG